MKASSARAVPESPAKSRAPHGILRADSLKLSILNAAAAVTARALEATGAYQDELLGVGVPLFLAPTLALLALAFGRRDLRHGWQPAVESATVLTLIALAISWWPLLRAD
jgi:hypothetical protein